MRRVLALALMLVAVCGTASADQNKAEDKMRQAARELALHNLPKAEKLLREAVQEDPSSIRAHRMLADLLISEGRYSQAADVYATALRLDESQKKLDQDDRRVTTNGYAVATAQGGNLPKAKEILEAAIKQDRDYAMYYYNLACTYAELGQLDPAVKYLQEAWNRRKNLAGGESFPDPREDTSFKPYLNDKRFLEAVRLMVF